MTERRRLDEKSLLALSLPRALSQELLKIDALGLDRPGPTEDLVRATLERCEEALKQFQPVPQPTQEEWEFLPSFAWRTSTLPGLAQSIGVLNACVHDRAVPFARQNPQEPAIVFIDNHALIDPERWKSDPSLQLLNQVYRMTESILETNHWKPIERLIILKEDLNAYGDKDLDVIRAAIERPAMMCTYLVAAKHAGSLKERSCTVVAKEVLFEMEKGDPSHGVMVKKPGGIADPERAGEVYRVATALKERAFAVYHDGKLNRRLQGALGSNAQLLDVLKSISL